MAVVNNLSATKCYRERKTIDLHDKVLLPRSLEIGFHPFIRGLSACVPQIWYAGLFAKPRCRYQPSRANSKLSYKLGNWHVSPLYEERLQRRRIRADLITALKIFTGPLDVDPNLFFPSYRSTRPKRAPLQGTPRCEPPPKEKVGIFGEGCEILE